EYVNFCSRHNFDKNEWIAGLTAEERGLLQLEIEHLHVTWLALLHKELIKPYFICLKQFLHSQKGKTIFPPPKDIYSWSHYTPLPEVKCLVLGQDPYHNFNQAHGLAFLVLEPTRPPPSLLNIYKALKLDFPDFVAPDYKKLLKEGKPGGGNLTKWAKRGVLMLNACLTVEAHKANSHANRGWEQFTEKVIETAITYARENKKQGLVIMAWGTPAQKRVAKFSLQLSKKEVPFLVLKSVHPSPLSASRGFFDLHVFEKCNRWLKEQGREPINWGLVEMNNV
ncbi:uracil-DNA glycosylase, partial [Metschnikowia bicuspidata var. bicuspidata NRRL YB-4993]